MVGFLFKSLNTTNIDSISEIIKIKCPIFSPPTSEHSSVNCTTVQLSVQLNETEEESGGGRDDSQSAELKQ